MKPSDSPGLIPEDVWPGDFDAVERILSTTPDRVLRILVAVCRDLPDWGSEVVLGDALSGVLANIRGKYSTTLWWSTEASNTLPWLDDLWELINYIKDIEGQDITYPEYFALLYLLWNPNKTINIWQLANYLDLSPADMSSRILPKLKRKGFVKVSAIGVARRVFLTSEGKKFLWPRKPKRGDIWVQWDRCFSKFLQVKRHLKTKLLLKSDLEILTYLVKHPEATMGDLATFRGVRSEAISMKIGTLKKRWFIDTIDNPDDARSKILFVTYAWRQVVGGCGKIVVQDWDPG